MKFRSEYLLLKLIIYSFLLFKSSILFDVHDTYNIHCILFFSFSPLGLLQSIILILKSVFRFTSSFSFPFFAFHFSEFAIMGLMA